MTIKETGLLLQAQGGAQGLKHLESSGPNQGVSSATHNCLIGLNRQGLITCDM